MACLHVSLHACPAQVWYSVWQTDATSHDPGPSLLPRLLAQLGLSSLRGEALREDELRILETYMNGCSGAENWVCQAWPGAGTVLAGAWLGTVLSAVPATLGCRCGLLEEYEGPREATPPKKAQSWP